MQGRKLVFVPSSDFEREVNVSGTVRLSPLITQITLDYANFCVKRPTVLKARGNMREKN